MSEANKNSIEKLESHKIKYPITFNLKIVVDNTLSTIETIQFIDKLLLRLAVANEYKGFKESSKGNFTSHTLQVLVLDESHMNDLYKGLKTIPGLKFAV